MHVDPRIGQEVDDLRRRVWLIEQRLGLVGAAPAPAPQNRPRPIELVSPPPLDKAAISALVDGTTDQPPAVEPSPSSPKSQAFSRLVRDQQVGPPVTRPSIIAAATRSNPIPPRVRSSPVIPPPVMTPRLAPLESAKRPEPVGASKPKSDFSLERLIGGRWYAWIGALAVVVGLGLFFKYA